MKNLPILLQKLMSGSKVWRHVLFFTIFFSFYMIGAVNDFVENGYQGEKMMHHLMQFGLYMIEFYLIYISYAVAKKQNDLFVMILAFAGIPLLVSLLSAKIWNVYLGSHPSTFLNYYPFCVFYFAMIVSIKYAKDKYVEHIQTLERSEQQKQIEINFLKSQISPHFLFNTLNNLYGHSVKKSDELPDMMIKLSELLRYSIYDANKPMVHLADELDYIKNYITLERMRLSKEIQIHFSFPEFVNPELQIAPLILINFVENAFKHSRNVIAAESFIDGDLKVNKDTLELTIKNAYNPNSNQSGFIRKENGIGQENSIKRLDLVYGNDYTLKINTDDNVFALHLDIKLSKS